MSFHFYNDNRRLVANHLDALGHLIARFVAENRNSEVAMLQNYVVGCVRALLNASSWTPEVCSEKYGENKTALVRESKDLEKQFPSNPKIQEIRGKIAIIDKLPINFINKKV